MNFPLVKALFSSCTTYSEELGQEYIHLTAARKALEELRQVLPIEDKADEQTAFVLEKFEEQGFINGFRLGMQLMQECGSAAPLDVWHPNERIAKGCEKWSDAATRAKWM